MKLVPPVVIDDTNMVSNAPDDDYPVWGTDYAVSEYPTSLDTRFLAVSVDWRTSDVWGVGATKVYKQTSGAGSFVQVAAGSYSFQGIAVNPYTGWAYVTHKESLEAVITEIHPTTHETAELGRFSIAADPGNIAIAVDGFTGDLFILAGAALYKYTYATDTLASHATLSGVTYSRSIAIDPTTKDLYVCVGSTNAVLMQTASTGAFNTMTGAWTAPRGVAIDELTHDVFVTDPVSSVKTDVYKRAAGAGSFSEVQSTTFYASGLSAALGDVVFSDQYRAILWAYSAKLFSEGQYTIYGSSIYYALTGSYNVTPGTDNTKWFLHSYLNRLRMFDSQLTTKTEVSGMNLIVSFTSNEIDTIGLFNVVGASVTVTVTNGGGVVESSAQTVSTRNVVFENLPSNINAVYQVIITPLNGVASCGNMVAGMSNAIGTLMRDVELSLVSYSKTTIDDFGRPSFTVRGRAKKLECAMRVEKTDSNRVYELFNQNDAKLCMWVGPSGYPHLTVFGWYQRFELQLGAADTAKYNLEIQGDVDTLATETSPALVTPGALEIVEAYLSAEGDGVFLLFNREAYVGAGGSGGVVVTIGETVYPLTYVSGDGTNAFLFEFSGAFVYDGTAVVAYTQPGNGIEDGDGGDLVVSTPVPLDLLYGGVHPTVVSITVAENGTTVTIVFDLPVSIGAGGSGGFTLNGAALTYVSGLPGNTAVFSVATILQGVTVTATYVQPGDGIEQTVSGLDLLSFSGVNVVNNSGTPPASIVSATINAAGNQLTVVFSEAMSQGAGYQNTDINLDGSLGGTGIGLTYVSGSGTDMWVFSIATVIRLGETVDLNYNGRPDGIENVSGNDLAAVISMAVPNGSEEAFSDIVFWEGFEGSIAGGVYTATAFDYPVSHAVTLLSSLNISISTSDKKVGSKSVYFNKANGYTYNPAYTDTDSIRCGAWLRAVAFTGTAVNFFASLGPNNCFIRAQLSATTSAKVSRLIPGVTFSAGYPVTLTVPTTTDWHYYEFAFNADTNLFTIYIDGNLVHSEIGTGAMAQAYKFNSLYLGYSDFNGYIDNLIISTDPNRDLYALALLEACPRV